MKITLDLRMTHLDLERPKALLSSLCEQLLEI